MLGLQRKTILVDWVKLNQIEKESSVSEAIYKDYSESRRKILLLSKKLYSVL